MRGNKVMNGEQEDTELGGFASPFALLPRPPGQLRALAIPFRWEVTRRHPYYLTFWTSARRFHFREPLQCAGEELLREAAMAILGSIGVSGPPFDPAIEFDQTRTNNHDMVNW